MPDRIVYPALVLIVAGLVALAFVWPQGQGLASPAPFGHPLHALDQTVSVNGQPVAVIRGAQEADAPPGGARSAPPPRP
ncbi:MAG: hypothetical protein ACHP7N_04670 [Caulobacterales bacterium]